MNETIQIKRLRPEAKLPRRATEGSAGLDLCACLETPLTLAGGETAVIPTGLAIALPRNDLAAFIFARSGLAVKHGIGLLNSVGVIDSDYRGELCVGVINQMHTPYTIAPGERIAQLVVLPVAMLTPVEVDALDETARGEGGFGSTGKV
ncbi:MAG: dUTP diphosphatase [Clostridia bacterium]|nr:dUTP diphosphatase [Clostridia bacterium]